MKLLLLFALVTTGFAETHRFEPKEFYNTFSSAHAPVLHIKPGDHVITYTIDARGVDSAGVQRGRGPNPETGPFYIEGAEPGDTLVVHLLRLDTNRATGFSASLLAPYTADPASYAWKRRESRRRPLGRSTSKEGSPILIRTSTKGRGSNCPCVHAGLRGHGPSQQGRDPHQFPG